MKVLVFLACIIAIGGFFFLSEATVGVGIMAAACLFAILARIAQAAEYHAELMEYYEDNSNE